ncbi:MAG: COP23 domain-containing protein [Leptolyngbya sp. IPPAS B-1204]
MSLRLSSLSLKRLGLSLGALLLGGSPLISFANAAQARPNWLNLERASSDRMSTVAQSSTPTRRSPTSTTTQNLNDVRFSCQVVNGQYTVMYNPQSQPGQYYPWATPTAMGGGWSPDRRCNEISRRLEFYRPDGLLELQTGLENGYNTVCVTTEAMPSCRIVLTVPKGKIR